jgi:CRISPR-associated protein (TIGR03984 family)
MTISIWSTRHTTFPAAMATPVIEWLEQEQHTSYQWLLAHTEPRVVWGYRSEGDGATWRLAHELPEWPLIHALRLFGDAGECLLQRAGDTWIQRIITDHDVPGGDGAQETEVFDQPYLLWGTDVDAQSDALPGFATVREGSQGLVQTLPLDIAPGRLPRRARLVVRHYLAQDSTSGIVRIATSRLRALGFADAVDGADDRADADDATSEVSHAAASS